MKTVTSGANHGIVFVTGCTFLLSTTWKPSLDLPTTVGESSIPTAGFAKLVVHMNHAEHSTCLLALVDVSSHSCHFNTALYHSFFPAGGIGSYRPRHAQNHSGLALVPQHLPADNFFMKPLDVHHIDFF